MWGNLILDFHEINPANQFQNLENAGINYSISWGRDNYYA